MKAEPFVLTDRLLLRDFLSTDFEALHAYASDPEVVRFLVWGPRSADQTRDFLTRCHAASAEQPRGLYELAVVERATKRLVGGIGLTRERVAAEQATLGYCFCRETWGQGFATEAARDMLRFGFHELGLHRIWAACDPENVASSRVLQKIGMRREGHFRANARIRGEWRGEFVFAILAEDWVGEDGVRG